MTAFGPERAPAVGRVASGLATVAAVAVFVVACGPTPGHPRGATVAPMPPVPAAPKPDLAHVGIVGPRGVDGYRFIGLPYVVATNKVPGPDGSHSYEIFFRLNRPLLYFGGRPTAGAMAVATVDDGYDGASQMYQLPGTSVACYSQTIVGAAGRYGEPLSSTRLVLSHGPGQIARLALFTAQVDPGPTLQANVRVSRAIMGDMVPASDGGPGSYAYLASGPYGRLLGCSSHLPGEVTWTQYEKLLRDGKASPR